MRKSFAYVALVAAVLGLLVPIARGDDAIDTKASQIAAEFISGLQMESIERVMKVADAPFFEDGSRVIADREGVEKLIRQVFEREDLTDIKFEITKVLAFEDVRDSFDDKDRGLLKDVMRAGDRIVEFRMETEGRKREGFRVFVRFREDTAKVVGVED